MKKGLLIALLFPVLSANPATAQQLPTKHIAHNSEMLSKQQKQVNRQKLLARLTGNGGTQSAAKTTSTVTSERLIAQSVYALHPDYTTIGAPLIWTIGDSADYKYSGQRGSYFNLNYMAYLDDCQFNLQAFMGFGNNMGLTNRDNKTEVLFDSMHYYTLIPISTYPFGHFETKYAIFDAANNITDYIEDYVAFMNAYRYKNTYTASGSVSSMLYLNNTAGTWDTTEFRDMGYASGLLVHDSANVYYGAGAWDPEGKFIYTYDAFGFATRMSYMSYDPPTMSWHEDARYDAEYYPDHRLKRFFSNSVTATGGLDPQYIDSFGWTTGVNYYTYRKDVEYVGGTINYTTVEKKHTSLVTNLPDTMYTQLFDTGSVTPESQYYTAYTYDSYMQPTEARDYAWRPATMAYDSVSKITHYYYETYTRDNTGLIAATENNNINLYPNPTTGTATLVLPENIGGYSIQVSDITGRTITTGDYTEKVIPIDISGNAPGMYLVRITNKQTHETTVKKLVVSR